MYLQRLSILNYRNIAECELQFSPKINCFLGRNGMGKTNLLDVVYYLSFCKSHLNPIDAQVIKHDADFFMIQGEFERQGIAEVVSCAVKRRAKKRFRRDQKEYDRLSDHIGLLPVVLVSPADLDLVNEGSDARRRFLDVAISQYDKPYLSALVRYNEALQNRNALLKRDEQPDAEMLDIYDEQMAAEAQYICAKRAEFITEFVPLFQEFYSAIAGAGERVGLEYTSHAQRGDLRQLLREVRDRDVALRLAQFVFLQRTCRVTPILLLDDIFDKLDADRVTRIMQLVSGDGFGQIFITDTNREHLDEILSQIDGESRLFEVSEGKVVNVIE